MQKPLTTLNFKHAKENFKVPVYLNVDKIEDFYFYTFEISPGNKIVISKFDGDQWKIANTIINNDLAEVLGSLIRTKL